MKTLSVIIAALLLFTNAARVSEARTKGPQAPARAEKVKAGVAKLGTGESARVEVRLRDGTRLRGYVREAGADDFVVVDKKTGAATAVSYGQVEKLGGVGLSTGAKVFIGLGIAAIVLLTMALVGLHYAD